MQPVPSAHWETWSPARRAEPRGFRCLLHSFAGKLGRLAGKRRRPGGQVLQEALDNLAPSPVFRWITPTNSSTFP